MDSIYISNLEIMTYIGVPDEERKEPQRVLVSVEMFTDTSKAGQDDDIHSTIDYDAVTQDVRSLAQQERKTIEKFAEDIAQMILEQYKPEGGTKVSIQKFVIPDTDSVSVTIFRNT